LIPFVTELDWDWGLSPPLGDRSDEHRKVVPSDEGLSLDRSVRNAGLVRLGVFCGRDCWVLHEKNRSLDITDDTSGILMSDFTQCADELIGASIPIETLRICSSVGFAHTKRVPNGTGQVVA
jgi:hypothetical protein